MPRGHSWVFLIATSLAGASFADAASRAPVGTPPAVTVVYGRLIDGVTATAIPRGAVVFEGDRILCAGRRERCPAPVGAQVVDAGTGTILPGLVDLHVHARTHYLAWFLAAGVTTIRDANNSLATIAALRSAPVRPRMFASGPMLDGPRTVMRTFGPSGVRRPASGPLDSAFTIEVETPDEARDAVDSLAAHGVQWIKLYEQLPPDAYRAATERAAGRGVFVMTDLGMHTTRGLSGAQVDAIEASAAGVRTIEHASGLALAYQRLGGDPQGERLDDQLLDSLVRVLVARGTAVIPTLSVFYAFSDSVTAVDDLPIGIPMSKEMNDFFVGGAARRTPASRARSHAAFRLAVEVARRMAMRGGLVGVGTDAPAGVYNLPGGAMHRELELLVREGVFTPLQAVTAATGTAGRILGEPGLGELRPGTRADLIIVDGDPSTDIRATRRIRQVWQAGRLLGAP